MVRCLDICCSTCEREVQKIFVPVPALPSRCASLGEIPSRRSVYVVTLAAKAAITYPYNGFELRRGGGVYPGQEKEVERERDWEV